MEAMMEIRPRITIEWLKSLDIIAPNCSMLDDFETDWPDVLLTRLALDKLHRVKEYKYHAYYTAILFRCFGGDPCGICPLTKKCRGFVGKKCFSHCSGLRDRMYAALEKKGW